jgi:C-terminal processing protease CtpA/Prc
MYTRPVIIAVICTLFFLAPGPRGLALAGGQEAPRETAEQLNYQLMLEEAERARVEAESARAEAAKAAEQAREVARQRAEVDRERARQLQAEAREEQREAREEQREAKQQLARERERQQEEMERAREELSRAHRELREASREIARAHRALAETVEHRQVIRHINLGDQAVIGVVLGKETSAGVEVIGVSPDGPAERAGVQAGDIMVSIHGQELGGEGGGRELLFRVMEDIQPGQEVSIVVERDGKSHSYEITAEQREPSSWQTLIRIPESPRIVGAVDTPHIVIEDIDIEPIDEVALKARVKALNDELKTRQFLFVGPDGEGLEFESEIVLPEDFEAEMGEYSTLAGHALREANVWFGLPHAQGLELVEINEGLGAYFKTDRGVLVVEAREDNAYQLQSGDVVLEIDSKPVNSPTDMMRALRELEPGSEIEIGIKRDRRDRTLSVVMPESRLGYSWKAQHRISTRP